MSAKSATAPFAALALRLKGLRSLSATDRLQALRKLASRLLTVLRGGRRRLVQMLIAGTERVLGRHSADRLFWRLLGRRSWTHVQARLDHLIETGDPDLAGFTRQGIAQSRDPMSLLKLASHPLCRDAAAAELTPEAIAAAPHLLARAGASPLQAAAILGAAAISQPEDGLRQIARMVQGSYPATSTAYFALLDSLGSRLAVPQVDPELRGLLQSGLRQPCRHRLILAESLPSRAELAALFPGAATVTVLIVSDTYGKLSFEEFADWPGIGTVRVEHIRSRVTRFSPAYIALHEATSARARDMAAALGRASDLLPEADQPAMALAIADHLFFEELRREALRQLCADPEFDHIAIVMHNHGVGSGFVDLLSQVPELTGDPRCEVISVSGAMKARVQFPAVLGRLLRPAPEPARLHAWAPPVVAIRDDLQARTKVMAQRLGLPRALDPDAAAAEPAARAPMLLVTTGSAAYDTSTIRYVQALAPLADLRLAHIGVNAADLLGHPDMPGPDQVDLLPNLHGGQFGQMERWLASFLTDYAADMPAGPARQTLLSSVKALAGSVIHSQIVHVWLLQAWFARMQAASALPALVILAPARHPKVAQFAATARAHGVPSLTLEAHGLNANYSRYTKVTTDYYGVISEQFRLEAAAGFGIPLERVRAIGTPRLIAPPPEEAPARQATARAEIRAQGHDFDRFAATIAFFCQPSGWDHVARVWDHVLQAAQALNLGILLKTHPEESGARVALYMAIADQRGLRDHVLVVAGDAVQTISAADVVLTGYSAAALDAAIMEVPVICVTDGAVDYPVDQHLIIGAPLVRNAADLQAHLAGLLADPAAARQQAAAFLAREPYFATGPDAALQAFVTEIRHTPRDQAIRASATLPADLFLDGPHPTFPV